MTTPPPMSLRAASVAASAAQAHAQLAVAYTNQNHVAGAERNLRAATAWLGLLEPLRSELLAAAEHRALIAAEQAALAAEADALDRRT